MAFYEVPDQVKGSSTDFISIPAKDDVVSIKTDPDLAAQEDGNILLASQVSRDNWFAGIVKTYDPATGICTLTVTKVGSNASAGNDSLDSWHVYCWDAAPKGIPFLQRNGLLVSISGTTITVTAGSIRDSTNTYDLVLASTITKDLTATWVAGSGNGVQVMSSNLAGTVSSSGTSVTGTSTTFFSDFTSTSAGHNTGQFPDYVARGGVFGGSPTAITVGGTVSTFQFTASDSAGTTFDALGASGSTYQRGGYYSAASSVKGPQYGLVLIRQDSTGAIDVAAYATYPGAAPDLPSGWSVFGALAVINKAGSVWAVNQWSSDPTLNQLGPQTMTEGALLVYSGASPTGDYAPLAVGTAGQRIISDGTDPTWANQWKTVDSGSLPSATSKVIALPAGYSDIVITWNGVSFNNATIALWAQVCTDGSGTNFDTTAANYAAGRLAFTAGVVTANASATMLNSGATQAAAASQNGSLTIFGYGTSGYKQFTSQQNSTTPAVFATIGTYLNTAAITHVRLMSSDLTAVFDAGTYVVSVK